MIADHSLIGGTVLTVSMATLILTSRRSPRVGAMSEGKTKSERLRRSLSRVMQVIVIISLIVDLAIIVLGLDIPSNAYYEVVGNFALAQCALAVATILGTLIIAAIRKMLRPSKCPSTIMLSLGNRL